MAKIGSRSRPVSSLASERLPPEVVTKMLRFNELEMVATRTFGILQGRGELRGLILLTGLALVACGGGGNSQSPSLTTPPIGGAFTVLVTARGEIEPNNSIGSANAQTLPVHGANVDFVGFGVTGTVDDVLDPMDFSSFAASQAHDFSIRLCPSICTQFDAISTIDTSNAYFEVLDQSGVLLLSSQGDIAAGNSQAVSIEAGPIYYLAVFAEDTAGAVQNYYVEMVEKHPLQ